MAKCFIAVIEDLTSAQHKKIAENLPQPIGWWHHLGCCWLIKDYSGKYSASSLREMLNEVAPSTVCGVFEVTPGDWALRLETSRIEDSDSWMNEFWKPED